MEVARAVSIVNRDAVVYSGEPVVVIITGLCSEDSGV
jgi:hypothetical protein